MALLSCYGRCSKYKSKSVSVLSYISVVRFTCPKQKFTPLAKCYIGAYPLTLLFIIVHSTSRLPWSDCNLEQMTTRVAIQVLVSPSSCSFVFARDGL